MHLGLFCFFGVHGTTREKDQVCVTTVVVIRVSANSTTKEIAGGGGMESWSNCWGLLCELHKAGSC